MMSVIPTIRERTVLARDPQAPRQRYVSVIDLTGEVEICSWCRTELDHHHTYVAACYCGSTKIYCCLCQAKEFPGFTCPSHGGGAGPFEWRRVYFSKCGVCIGEPENMQRRVVMKCGHLFCSKDAWDAAGIHIKFQKDQPEVIQDERSVPCPYCRADQGHNWKDLRVTWLPYEPDTEPTERIVAFSDQYLIDFESKQGKGKDPGQCAKARNSGSGAVQLYN